MARSILFFLLLSLHSTLYSQLPNGAVAPDFDVEDIHGNSVSLYAMMGNNKSACLAFEATWCGFCWHFHLSGVLSSVYNNLSANTVVIMLESDWNTNTDCLYGNSNCNNFSNGDWVTGTPYSIVDLSATNGPTVSDDYFRNYYPLLYVISPDKRVWEIIERTYQNYSNWITKSFFLDVNPSLTHSTCGDNGKIVLNATGGYSVLNYKWSNGATTRDLNNIPGGTYSVKITDANGYFKEFGPFVINGPEKRVDVVSANLNHVKCFDQSTGSISIQADFGTPPYLYKWSNGNTTTSLDNIKASSYLLTITDNVGCTRLKTYIINQPPVLKVNAVISKENCDNLDGFIQTKPSGGVQPYSFDIGDGQQSSPDFTQLKGGRDYTITVTDFNLCVETYKVHIEVSHKPKADAGKDTTIDCKISPIQLDGSLSDKGNGFNSVWNTINGNIVKGKESLFPDIDLPGMYYLDITDINNKCVAVDSVFVADQRVFPDILATGDTTLNCDLKERVLSGNSKDLPIKYYWKKINDSLFIEHTKQISVSDSGKFVFYVKDTIDLCISKDTVEIHLDQTLPEIVANPEKELSCIYLEVIIDASLSSKGPEFNYLWTTTNGNIISGANSLMPLVNKSGNYLLEVENKVNFCKNSLEVLVYQQTQPEAAFEKSSRGLKVDLKDSSNGRPTSWNWDFGDGGKSTLQNPSHVFSSKGEYEVCLTVENDCGKDMSCEKVFVQELKSEPVVLHCPVNVNENSCQTDSVIHSKFSDWLATANFTGGCDSALLNNNTGAPSSCGGSKFVTFTVTSSCEVPVTCTSAFSVSPASPVVFLCPANQVVDSCKPQIEIDSLFALWLESAEFTGGCNGILSNNSSGAPSACGGYALVEFAVNSDCEPAKKCNGIFTVNSSAKIVLECPAEQIEATGQSQAVIDEKFAIWLNKISFSGGCDPWTSNNNSGAPPYTGGSVTVLFTATNKCQDSVICFSFFSVKDPDATVRLNSIKNLKLIPNPVSNQGFVMFELDRTQNYTLNIRNVFGVIVYKQSGKTEKETISMDLKEFPKGVYFVELNTDTGRNVMKWVIN